MPRPISKSPYRSREPLDGGRGSSVVDYNVLIAVDIEHRLIVAHDVTNSGSDRGQLASMAKQAKAVVKTRRSGRWRIAVQMDRIWAAWKLQLPLGLFYASTVS